MRLNILLLGIFLISVFAYGDNLDNYIRQGLENNLALKQKEFNYIKSMHALKEARGMFFPSISIEARYTRAGGGREIEFPVGDLMNPVYSTLNQLTGTQSFPQLENERIPFLREKEHETKLRLIQPLFQYGIYSNYNLKDELEKASMEDVAKYKQELIRQIKTAYYQYIQASKIKDLYNGTMDLVNENVRVSQVLFENDMVTQDAIFRSKAEKLKIEQELASAIRKYILARSYFNFLLNRELDVEIAIDDVSELPVTDIDPQNAETRALNQRKEIMQLTYALKASHNAVGLATANYYPGLNLVVDYGFQGSEYNFDKDNDYWMASLIFSWNLFNGFQDSEKRQQAQMNYKIVQTQLQELKQKIRLQVKDAYQALDTARKNYQSAQEQEKYNSESYKIISKKYEQGLASQIELIDARVNMTNSKIGSVVNYYNYLINYVNFLQISGALNVEDFKE